MRAWVFFGAAVALLSAGGCAPATGPQHVADVRAHEAESAAKLSAEGQVLYAEDVAKRNGYEYCSLAVGLIEQGEFRRAIREASKALYLGAATGDRCLSAFAQRDLAQAYSFAGEIDRAREFADQALRGATSCREPWRVQTVAYKVLGDVLLRQGRPKEAIEQYEKVPEGNVLLGGGAGGGHFVRISLANAYLVGGDPKKATQLLLEAQRSATDPTQLALVRRGLGRVALADGRPGDAGKLFEESVRLASGPDAAYHRLWALDGLARARQASGDQGGAIAAYRQAVETAEEVRARFRSEEFRAGFFGETQTIFDAAVEQLVESGQGEAAFAISDRGRARALQDLLRGRVTARSGGDVVSEPVGRTTTVSELRAILPGDVTLVQYHVTRERTYAWVVSSAGVRTVRIEVERETLARETERFRKATRQLAPDAPALGVGLYERLIRPLGLDEGVPVVIVPHGPLHYLPFQALRGPGGYLVERHSISYAASAASVVYGLSRQGVGHARGLALGNPDLGDPRKALPAAEREVEQIKEYFPGVEIYVRRAATKERLMGRAPESELVHVAAHAEIDEIDPVYSVVKLARSERMPGELEAHEIYGMDLRRTRLVVLSACDSGLGRISRGDEVWGFTRSFLVAGARTLIVSLWPVEDQATSRLMGSFYAELRRRGPRDSLRAAQLQLLRDAQTSHPFFWAAFNVVGDWR